MTQLNDYHILFINKIKTRSSTMISSIHTTYKHCHNGKTTKDFNKCDSTSNSSNKHKGTSSYQTSMPQHKKN